MPILDGLDATREWRAREAAQGRKHLPVIAVTANAFVSDRTACLAAGMDDFMAKPVTLVTIQAVLDKWLAGSGGDTVALPRSSAMDQACCADTPALDGAQLTELRMLMGSRFGEFVNVFSEDASPRLAALQRALEQGDRDDLRRIAHLLKGCAANVGAVLLAGLCAELERLTQKDEARMLAGQVARIEAETRRVVAALAEAAVRRAAS